MTELDFVKSDNIGGTSLKGSVECSYSDIVAVFGEPSEGTDKTDAEWAIEFSCGTVATLYNWKNGVNYCGAYGTPVEQITQWNIGGHFGADSVELVKKALDK